MEEKDNLQSLDQIKSRILETHTRQLEKTLTAMAVKAEDLFLRRHIEFEGTMEEKNLVLNETIYLIEKKDRLLGASMSIADLNKNQVPAITLRTAVNVVD